MKRVFSKSLKLISLSMLALSLCISAIASVNVDIKKDYYKQYKQIIEEAQKTYDTDNVKLVPFEELTDEDFIAPEEFKKIVDDIAKGNYIVIADNSINANNVMPFSSDSRSTGSSVSGTKSAKISNESKTFTLDITGKFTTQYSCIHKRQIFQGLKSVDVKCTTRGARWYDNGCGKTFLDGGRTCEVTVQGYIQYGSMYFGLVDATVKFYCTSGGGVN